MASRPFKSARLRPRLGSRRWQATALQLDQSYRQVGWQEPPLTTRPRLWAFHRRQVDPLRPFPSRAFAAVLAAYPVRLRSRVVQKLTQPRSLRKQPDPQAIASDPRGGPVSEAVTVAGFEAGAVIVFVLAEVHRRLQLAFQQSCLLLGCHPTLSRALGCCLHPAFAARRVKSRRLPWPLHSSSCSSTQDFVDGADRLSRSFSDSGNTVRTLARLGKTAHLFRDIARRIQQLGV